MLGNRGIDHLVLSVNDLNSARLHYEMLGFTVTPVAHHPFGTSNALVQLQTGFLELVAITAPEKITPETDDTFSFGEFNRQFLERHEGLSMLVYQTQDARADQAAFNQSGLKTYAPFDFSRQAKLPDGQEVEVSFSLAFVADEPSVSNAMFFCCQQHAPEHFWKLEYQRHANGAQDVSEALMLARDLEAANTFFAKLHGQQHVSMASGVLSCRTGKSQITVFDQESYNRIFEHQPRVAPSQGMVFFGLTIEARDLDTFVSANSAPDSRWVEVDYADRISEQPVFGLTLCVNASH